MNETPQELHELVLGKLSRIVGLAQAERELASALEQSGLEAIRSIDDLARVSEILRQREGFVATVGALLSVEVAMRRLRAP